MPGGVGTISAHIHRGDKFQNMRIGSFFSQGIQALLIGERSRTLMSYIRSNRLGSVSSVGPRLIADALFTRISIPPKRSTVLSTTCCTYSKRIYHIARPGPVHRRLPFPRPRENSSRPISDSLPRLGGDHDIGAFFCEPQANCLC